ncbi:Uncharacterized protein dnm_044050 [Desulfonema magnum]|uniref:Uncharacterized protein n=1 Tax=Desulfonema magnum TaxID=45655 RepID=A0A975GNV6_9BACT|nr:Uncharacterized protein dnm_044050 [Desulfonema magnum]
MYPGRKSRVSSPSAVSGLRAGQRRNPAFSPDVVFHLAEKPGFFPVRGFRAACGTAEKPGFFPRTKYSPRPEKPDFFPVRGFRAACGTAEKPGFFPGRTIPRSEKPGFLPVRPVLRGGLKIFSIY